VSPESLSHTIFCQAEKTLETNRKRVFSGKALIDWLLQYEGDKFGGKPGDQGNDDGDDSDVAVEGVAPHSAIVDGVVVDAVAGGSGGIIGVDRAYARSFCDDMQQSGEIISLQKLKTFEDSETATYRFSSREFEIEDLGENENGLPASFDLDYFTNGICQLLVSRFAHGEGSTAPPRAVITCVAAFVQNAEHFQIVLKTLSFIYNQTVLFHGAFREKLVTEILLKGFFFRLFLHWMHEIRRYFLHILVYKIFRTSRKLLPCKIDNALLKEGATIAACLVPADEGAPLSLRRVYVEQAPRRTQSKTTSTSSETKLRVYARTTRKVPACPGCRRCPRLFSTRKRSRPSRKQLQTSCTRTRCKVRFWPSTSCWRLRLTPIRS